MEEKEYQHEAVLPRKKFDAFLRTLEYLNCIVLDDIIILPLCLETFRELVYHRYMGSTRKEITYHKVLIRFFIEQSTSHRRSEVGTNSCE